MLVLSRKPGETIRIPSLGITITLTQMSGNRAKIGVDASSEDKILRGELEGTDPSPPKLEPEPVQ